jgi:hypothetical protein
VGKKRDKKSNPIVFGLVILIILVVIISLFLFFKSGECKNRSLEKCGEKCVKKGICSNEKIFEPNEIVCLDGTLFKANNQGSRLNLFQKCEGYGCSGTICNEVPNDNGLKCNQDCELESSSCTRGTCRNANCFPVSYESTIDRTSDCKDDCTGEKIKNCEISKEDEDGDGVPDSLDSCPDQYSIFTNGCDIKDIMLNGMRTKKDILMEEGMKAGQKLRKEGLSSIASSGYVPKYDYIKMRYYYDGANCQDMIQGVVDKFGDLVTLELIQDVNSLSVEEKEFVYTNWANHLKKESMEGTNILKFPIIVYYGPGAKYDGEKEIERFEELVDYGLDHVKIKGVAPGYVTVSQEEKTCCEDCLYHTPCNALLNPPDFCEEYLSFQITSNEEVEVDFRFNTEYDIS